MTYEHFSLRFLFKNMEYEYWISFYLQDSIGSMTGSDNSELHLEVGCVQYPPIVWHCPMIQDKGAVIHFNLGLTQWMSCHVRDATPVIFSSGFPLLVWFRPPWRSQKGEIRNNRISVLRSVLRSWFYPPLCVRELQRNRTSKACVCVCVCARACVRACTRSEGLTHIFGGQPTPPSAVCKRQAQPIPGRIVQSKCRGWSSSEWVVETPVRGLEKMRCPSSHSETKQKGWIPSSSVFPSVPALGRLDDGRAIYCAEPTDSNANLIQKPPQTHSEMMFHLGTPWPSEVATSLTIMPSMGSFFPCVSQDTVVELLRQQGSCTISNSRQLQHDLGNQRWRPVLACGFGVI